MGGGPIGNWGGLGGRWGNGGPGGGCGERGGRGAMGTWGSVGSLGLGGGGGLRGSEGHRGVRGRGFTAPCAPRLRPLPGIPAHIRAIPARPSATSARPFARAPLAPAGTSAPPFLLRTRGGDARTQRGGVCVRACAEAAPRFKGAAADGRGPLPGGPGVTMVCGGFACSRNALCALNVVYVVSGAARLWGGAPVPPLFSPYPSPPPPDLCAPRRPHLCPPLGAPSPPLPSVHKTSPLRSPPPAPPSLLCVPPPTPPAPKSPPFAPLGAPPQSP